MSGDKFSLHSEGVRHNEGRLCQRQRARRVMSYKTCTFQSVLLNLRARQKNTWVQGHF